MIKKALSLIAAIAAMAAAAAVCVVAAAFALYAVVRDPLGPAGAAAVVAAVAALIAVIVAVVLTRKAKPRSTPAQQQQQQGGLAARLIELARDKPIIAAGAAVAAGLVLMRNPKLMTTVVTVAMANRAGKVAGREERRR